MTSVDARVWTRFLLVPGLCLPLLAGSTDQAGSDATAEAVNGVVTPAGEPVSIVQQYEQSVRDRMSPTDLPGATGSAAHPSHYGPRRTDPSQGTPRHAYSPFDAAATTKSHCPADGCKHATNAVLVKLEPTVAVASPKAAGARLSAMSVSEPDLSQVLMEQGLEELEPLFPGAAKPARKAMAMRADGTQVAMPDLTRWYRVKAAPGAADLDVPALVAKLAAQPGVAQAEPDYVRKPLGQPSPLSLNDPLYGQQWHLDAVNAQGAWDYLASQGLPAGGSPDVVVAVIDTGVDYRHPDLAANMWINPAEFNGQPGVDDDGNGYVDDIYGASVVAGAQSGDPLDDHGHGTHVAGIIAAQGGNGLGGLGVAPGVKIMAIKAAQYSGVLNASDIARGIYYAVEKGADVINMSFGGYGRSQAEEDALTVAFGTSVLVAAAGNDGRPNLPCPFGANMYPAAYNWVLGAALLTCHF
jgi:subtilisin family serine protease